MFMMCSFVLSNDYLISEQSTKYIFIFHWSWQTGNNFGRLGTILNWQSIVSTLKCSVLKIMSYKLPDGN